MTTPSLVLPIFSAADADTAAELTGGELGGLLTASAVGLDGLPLDALVEVVGMLTEAELELDTLLADVAVLVGVLVEQLLRVKTAAALAMPIAARS